MFTFSGAIVETGDAGGMIPARNRVVTFVDAVTGAPVTFADGTTKVTTDNHGRFSGLQHAGFSQIKPVVNGYVSEDIINAAFDVAATAKAAADSAAASAASAQAARDAANLTGSPAAAAIDAYVGAGGSVAVRKSDLAANVKDAKWGAKGDGVTDDTAAIQACIAANDNVLIPAGTFLVEAGMLTINARTGFRLDMVGRLKRKNGSARASTLIVYNSSNVRIDRFNSDGNAANNLYNALPVDEAKHDLRIEGSTDVVVGTVDSVNPSGDAVYVTGATARLTMGNVRSSSSSAMGRNALSIVQGSQIHVDSVECYGTGYTTMPSGFDIEPNAGQTVSDVTIGQVYTKSSGTGGFTVFGNYTVGGVRQISHVKVGQVTVIKSAGTPTNACDVPIKGVTDLTVQSISITQDAAATNQAFSIDDADSLDLFIDAPTSRGAVPPNIGAGAPVTNMRLRGRVGQSGSHCLNIWACSDSEIDMKLKSPASGVLVVKQSTGVSANVTFRGDWRKVTGAAAIQANGAVEWSVLADTTGWPSIQTVIGTGAAGIKMIQPNAVLQVREAPLTPYQFGATDAGATTDNTAALTAMFAAAVAATPAGAEIYLPPGYWNMKSGSTPLPLAGDLTIRGAGRLKSQLRAQSGYTGTSMFSWNTSISGLRIENLRLSNGASPVASIFAPGASGGLYAATFKQLFIDQQIAAGRIYMQDNGASYIHVTWEECELQRITGSTVAPFYVRTSAGAANCNMMKQVRANGNNATATPFFYIESTLAQTYLTDWTWIGIIGEQNPGGLIHSKGACGWTLIAATDEDATVPYSNHVFKFDANDAGLHPRDITMIGSTRRGSTLAAGIKETWFSASSRGITLIACNPTPTSATPQFTLPSTGATLLGCRNATANTPANSVGAPLGLQAYTTATRPTATSFAAGTAIYDSDVKKIIITDGAAWRDSAGVTA